MKAFAQIAVPHEDIVKGRLTMDVFAADLWQVAKGEAPIDYQDPDLFFKKTFLTKGLKNILQVAKKRLDGESGDAVIQLQTPFGGGKTHALIALYHKAKDWNAKVVAFDGTALNPRETKPWEELERQLTGKIEITKGDIAPGKENLIKLLSHNSPALILMDEVLSYITKAAGIKVGDSNLAAQTFAFIQELTGAVATVGNVLLVITLPTSILEHYDENAERVFQQLQKITGRTEKIYTPVQDEEIEHIVRARLFSEINEKEVKKIVNEFVEYAKKEGLLSESDVSDYRNRFLKSYPFKPEVIEILYKRWGSFPTFQRTRGVLRLLSLVIHDILDKNIPFIRLGDFNLNNEEIRRELVKYIGQEWDSIIAQDITSENSGAKKVDNSLGSAYKPYKLGTTVATTIFMNSFSGKGEKGSSIIDIKLSTAYPELSSTVIDTAISHLKEKLFYLSDEGLFFTNQPNLNRIIISREEIISDNDVYEEERKLIEKHVLGSTKFRVYIHPKFPRDIPDTSEMKLVVLNKTKPDKEFLEKYGENPRVYRNVLIFLCMDESQKEGFFAYLRKILALRSIEEDERLKLTDAQRKEIKNKIEKYEHRGYEELRKLYRKLYLPIKDNYKEMDIGLPTFGETRLDREIYEYLRNQGEILEKITPKVIKDKYLGDKDYIEIKNLYDALLKTPGELRLVSKEVLIESIKEGVKSGLFGFGHVSAEEIKCDCFKETPIINLSDDEVIIRPELCTKYMEETISFPISAEKLKEQQVLDKEKVSKGEAKEQETKKKYQIGLKLGVPVGQISTIARIVTQLKNKFSRCEIEITIHASNGEIDFTEYENKIIDPLKEAGVRIEDIEGKD